MLLDVIFYYGQYISKVLLLWCVPSYEAHDTINLILVYSFTGMRSSTLLHNQKYISLHGSFQCNILYWYELWCTFSCYWSSLYAWIYSVVCCLCVVIIVMLGFTKVVIGNNCITLLLVASSTS